MSCFCESADSRLSPRAVCAPVVGQMKLGLVNGSCSDECVGMSTIEIGGVGVEDGVGIEGGHGLGLSSPVHIPCLFPESDVKDASLETQTKRS